MNLNRATADQMTSYVALRYGAEFYATAARGHRRIIRRLPGLQISIVASARTWGEALRQADQALAAKGE